MKRNSSIHGIVLIVLALQVLPFSDIIAKYLSETLPVIQVIWARFFFHCLFSGTYCAVKYGRSSVMPKFSSILFYRSVALFCAVGLFYVSIHNVPLTTSLTLWFVEPFILTAMAAAFFGERVTNFQWAVVLVGFCGILIAIRPDIVEWHWAYIVGLCSGVFYALFLLLTRFIDKDTPQLVSVYQTGLFGCIAASLVVAPFWVTPSIEQLVLLAATGLIAAIAHLLIVKSFELADASTIAPFTYSEILMASVLGYLVFGHVPDIWLYVGLMVIVTSGTVLAYTKNKPATAQ